MNLLTAEQQSRFEAFRRSSLNKRNMKRVRMMIDGGLVLECLWASGCLVMHAMRRGSFVHVRRAVTADGGGAAGAHQSGHRHVRHCKGLCRRADRDRCARSDLFATCWSYVGGRTAYQLSEQGLTSDRCIATPRLVTYCRHSSSSSKLIRAACSPEPCRGPGRRGAVASVAPGSSIPGAGQGRTSAAPQARQAAAAVTGSIATGSLLLSNQSQAGQQSGRQRFLYCWRMLCCRVSAASLVSTD